jgi:hypothetical protein
MDYVGFAELAVAASNAGGLDIRKQSRSLPM